MIERVRVAAAAGVLVLAGLARADSLGDVRRAAPTCDPARAHCLALAVHIAADDHGLIVTPDWIATQIATANHHFARLDVGFQLASVDLLPASAAHVETRRDRDDLAEGRLDGAVIHVFFVGTLDDVDVDGAFAGGVTWHQRKDDRKYLIVSSRAYDR